MERIGQNQIKDGLRMVKHLFVTWNVAGHKDHHQSESSMIKDLVKYSNKRGSGRGYEDVLVQVASR